MRNPSLLWLRLSHASALTSIRTEPCVVVTRRRILRLQCRCQVCPTCADHRHTPPTRGAIVSGTGTYKRSQRDWFGFAGLSWWRARHHRRRSTVFGVNVPAQQVVRRSARRSARTREPHPGFAVDQAFACNSVVISTAATAASALFALVKPKHALDEAHGERSSRKPSRSQATPRLLPRRGP